MARFDNPLDHVRVASPCNADWDQMIGNERARFCGQCNLNVYNLSSMTQAEAERLVFGTEGRLCVRYFKRTDGSILTKDCPVGLRAFRRRMSYVARAVSSAVLSFLAGAGAYEVSWRLPGRQSNVMGAIPVQRRVLPVVQPTVFPMEVVEGQLEINPPRQGRVHRRALRKS